MRADFQQAMADVTASPDLCRALRADPGLLEGRYDLTLRERGQMLAILRHAGMQAACKVYRMNRIAPLAMNLRATLGALGHVSLEPPAVLVVEEVARTPQWLSMGSGE